MLILGWGKDNRILRHLGIKRCSHCNNQSRFNLHEMGTKVNLYFIPVARFNFKYFVACEICGAGYEIDGGKKEELLKSGGF